MARYPSEILRTLVTPLLDGLREGDPEGYCQQSVCNPDGVAY